MKLGILGTGMIVKALMKTIHRLELESDVDTVYVALPNHLHFPFAKKALENGKHVIIEKPVTSNGRELEELIAIARQQSLMIFEARS